MPVLPHFPTNGFISFQFVHPPDQAPDPSISCFINISLKLIFWQNLFGCCWLKHLESHICRYGEDNPEGDFADCHGLIRPSCDGSWSWGCTLVKHLNIRCGSPVTSRFSFYCFSSSGGAGEIGERRIAEGWFGISLRDVDNVGMSNAAISDEGKYIP